MAADDKARRGRSMALSMAGFWKGRADAAEAALSEEKAHRLALEARLAALADEWLGMTWGPFSNPGFQLRRALPSDEPAPAPQEVTNG